MYAYKLFLCCLIYVWVAFCVQITYRAQVRTHVFAYGIVQNICVYIHTFTTLPVCIAYIYIHMYLYRCTFYIHAYTCIYINVHSYFYICENTCRNTNTYKLVHVHQCLRVKQLLLQTSKYAPCAQGLFTCICLCVQWLVTCFPCLVFVDERSPMRSYLSGCACDLSALGNMSRS
jgi:hypothetical protein